MNTISDFYRLAQGLRCVNFDFDYIKTRQLLEPHWNPYHIPPGHDMRDEHCHLIDANLLTSQHADDPEMHRIILDLDYGSAHYYKPPPAITGHHLILKTKSPIYTILDNSLLEILDYCKILNRVAPQITRHADGSGTIDIYTDRDLALVPSSTPGHAHLIMDVDIPWEKYVTLLNIFGHSSIIETGYAKASIQKHFTAIRPPWIHK